jgi:PAS domain S-box-containing protein
MTTRLTATTSAADSERAALERIKNIPATIYQWFVDSDGSRGLLYLSERWEEITGVSRERIIEDWTVMPVHEDDRAAWAASIERSVAEGRDWRHACRLILGDGRVSWVCMRATRTVVSPTRVVYTGLITDITAEREEAQRAGAAAAEDGACRKARG